MFCIYGERDETNKIASFPISVPIYIVSIFAKEMGDQSSAPLLRSNAYAFTMISKAGCIWAVDPDYDKPLSISWLPSQENSKINVLSNVYMTAQSRLVTTKSYFTYKKALAGKDSNSGFSQRWKGYRKLSYLSTSKQSEKSDKNGESLLKYPLLLSLEDIYCKQYNAYNWLKCFVVIRCIQYQKPIKHVNKMTYLLYVYLLRITPPLLPPTLL